ncbi:hypothetical protein [Rhizobium rhizophilum]|uniref:Uncharacterized protein n=1 Tax=Rhizobium rhizophilum TaxID=1850373 RepID=A0ABY2QPJ6_9HYPH|nr:hypothetical protein [Rhizobium rhizophilum]THV09805.1 hypothetical protein E9677_24925 [Rhizobium rhizophilum]
MLKKANLVVVALATLVSGGATLASVGVASAEVFTRKENINRDVCYQSRRVPATVAYNTRGIKLKDAARSWDGNMQRHGARVTNRYHDEVYVQTREVIEDQHMTLVPVPCR